MGCHQSLLARPPGDIRRDVVTGTPNEAGSDLTLVQKWEQFRAWIQRPRRRKTKVKLISIHPSQSYTRVAVTGEVRNFQTDITTDEKPTTNNEESLKRKNDNNIRNQDVPVKEKICRSPRLTTTVASQSAPERNATGQLQRMVHLPGAVEDKTDFVVSFLKHETVIDNQGNQSGSTRKMIRPKAAKGKRTVCVQKASLITATPEECLNTWMRRRLSEEGHK